MSKEVPIWEKVMLTVNETAAYSGIGVKAIRQALKKPNCTFSFCVGARTLVKRKEFEAYISKHSEL